MYTCGYDKDAGLLVGLFSGASSSEKDFADQFAALRQLDADGRLRQDVLAYVLQIEHKHAAPDAKMRKRIADNWAALRAPRVAMAVVTTSAIHRGAITVAHWFVPDNAARTITAHSEFSTAERWIESLRGCPVPQLAALLARARQSARTDGA